MPFETKINWIEQIPTIREMGLQGQRMPDIAKYYGVTRQRIEQILKRHIPEWSSIYGGVVLRNKAKAKHFAKWGDKKDTGLYDSQRLKFRVKKANALRTGYTWTVEFGELDWPEVCPILGLPLDYFAETCLETSPSFDRIDSNLGYIKGNVQVVSWRANRIKNNGTAEEHRRIADYLDILATTTVVSQ